MNAKTHLLTVLLALGLANSPSFAADKTWDRGGGVNDWTTPANWDADTAPVAGDSLFFAGSATGNNNNFTAFTQFNGLTFNADASSFTLAGNAINLGGNITNASANNQAISLALALQQNVLVNTGSVGTATADGTTLSGIISGGFGLEKTGSGRLSLSGGNTFSGGVRISNGTLHTSNATGLGTGIVTLGSVAGTENVMLAIQSVNPGNNLVIGAGSGTRTIQNQGGNANITGSVTLFKDLIVEANGTSSINFNTGRITGSDSIIVRAPTASVVISGSASRASFTGNVMVENGTFSAGNTGGNMNIAGATLNVANGATYNFNNAGTVGGLVGVAGSTATGSGGLRLGGSGTYAYAGTLSGTGGLNLRMNYEGRKGTQTISGITTFTGGTDIGAGKLILDYGTENSSKLADGQALTFRAGTLELANGSHNEVVASTTIVNAGQVNINRTSGSSTISLGSITASDVGIFGGSGALNFSHSNIATTTTANTNGILGSRARFTVGGADWAINDGSNNIVALPSYSTFVGSGGNNSNNYLLEGSGTVTANQTFNTLKITTTGAGQTLALGDTNLQFNNAGLLFTGAHDYGITTSGTGTLGGKVILHNYGAGVLTLGRLSVETFEHAGTGKTVLTTATGSGTANNRTGFQLSSGTVQFSANDQLVGQSNLRLHSGMLVADTTGGDISLTNDSVGGHRTISIGTDVPTIDVIGGGTLTIGGVISTNDPNAFLVTPIVYGSADSSGTIAVNGNNTYLGDTRLDGVRLSVNTNTSLGDTSAAYKVVFSRNSTLNTTADIATARYYDINSGVTGTIETNASTTLTHNGTISGAGNLRKTGAGTLVLSGTNTYSGNTTIAAGTLRLLSTGTIARSPVINLGTAGSQGTLDVTDFSAFTLAADQTLTGHGTVNIGAGKTLSIAGNLAPGNSPGITNVTGNLELLSSSITTMELGGLTAGTQFDQVNVSGALTYGGTLNIVSWNGWDINQVAEYNLFDFASYAGNFSTVSVGGTGLTFDTVNTWTGNNGGVTYSFTMDNGVLAVIPEPGTLLLMGLSLAALLLFRRRR